MKSGYYIYKNEKYIFELEDNCITVVNENGYVDWEIITDNLNGKYEEKDEIQILKVKLFPNWNDAVILHNYNLDSIGYISTFTILGILEFKTQEKNINAINIYAKELEYIYDSKRKILGTYKNDSEGNMNFSIKSFKEANSIKKQIKVDGTFVDYSFTIKRTFPTKDINNYLNIDSILKFEWENVKDYTFIYDLIIFGYNFIVYLCYRKNIKFKSIDLLSRNENNQYLNIGEMTIFIHNIEEAGKNYIKKHYIDYENIKTIDNKILQAIVDENIFIRHIPENEINRNQITPQSFVMVSSAFEWEFKQLFPKGIEHDKKKITNIKEIKCDLEKLSDNYNNAKKKIIFKAIDEIGKDNLESKIIYVNKKLKEISSGFLENLCKLNNVKNKNKIFTSLQRLRNDFAHGNMDINIDSDGFIGIVYLERLVYIMQLKRFGLDDKNIKMIINKLF